MGVFAASRRKRFLVLVFLLFTLLYWALFFPLLWLHTRPLVTRATWVAILLTAVLLFVILALITAYLVRKYNWWIGVPTRVSNTAEDRRRSCPRDYGFQAALHRYPSEEILPCVPQSQVKTFATEAVEMTTVKSSTPRRTSTQANLAEICRVHVDRSVLRDQETQTEVREGSISPGVYRTSLIMDVQPRSPRTPSSSDSLRNSWFYPTLADYYQDKTLKLKVRLDKAQQRQLELEQQEGERELGCRTPTGQNQQTGYFVRSVSSATATADTKTFLHREQVYSDLEIR